MNASCCLNEQRRWDEDQALWVNFSPQPGLWLRGLNRYSSISFSWGSYLRSPAHPGSTWPMSNSIWMMKPTMFEKMKVVEGGVWGQGLCSSRRKNECSNLDVLRKAGLQKMVEVRSAAEAKGVKGW